jgi:hypothetical protein
MEVSKMSKVKRIYVEAARTKNFQKYTCGIELELDESDDLDMEIKKHKAMCRKYAQEEIKIDDCSPKK